MGLDGVRQRGVYLVLNPANVARVFIIQIVDKNHLGKQFLRWVEILLHLNGVTIAEITQVIQGSPSTLPQIQSNRNTLTYLRKSALRYTVILP